MVSVRVKAWILALTVIMTAGCGGMVDDLNPSGQDKQPVQQPGTIGPNVGQNAPDFTLPDDLGNTVTLSSVLQSSDGVVMYFTMWCPICWGHMDHLRTAIIPNYHNVRFYAVDYVSASIAVARNREISDGFAGSGFTVLVDTSKSMLSLYHATMGTTVVIDRNGVIRMSEDYKDGARLQSALANLP